MIALEIFSSACEEGLLLENQENRACKSIRTGPYGTRKGYIDFPMHMDPV